MFLKELLPLPPGCNAKDGECEHGMSGLRGKRHAAQGGREKYFRQCILHVARHSSPLQLCTQQAGEIGKRQPYRHIYFGHSCHACLVIPSARLSAATGRGATCYSQKIPQEDDGTPIREGESEGRRASILLAGSRALAEIRAFSRSSFLPSESLPRGIERPPSLLPSFHIALMV